MRGRPLALGERGMVATPHQFASVAALRVLQEGGNAIDAAVTASAVLCVVYPHMAGVGGDLMALVWQGKTRSLHGLNASGRAPAAASLEDFRARGLSVVPELGPLSITVPGAVDGWDQLLSRFGSRSLGDVLAPAIAYAESALLGATVADRLARDWPRMRRGPATTAFDRVREPREGSRLAQPELRASLMRLAHAGAADFYQGELAQRLAAGVRDAGGLLTAGDLAAHRSEWVEPLTLGYRGLRIVELPPSTQGITVLQICGMLDGFPVRAEPFDPDRVHDTVEATKLALADRDRYIADPLHVAVPVRDLLSSAYLDERRARIVRERASRDVRAGAPGARGDTVYLAVADREGNVVSLIESLFGQFGSGVVAGDTGILLHDRGAGFSLDPASPNRLAAGKRPSHTLIPGMALRGDSPVLAFGSMGGEGQAQFHAQLLAYIVECGLDLQSAIEMPRWLCGRWSAGDPAAALHLERRVPVRLRSELARRGHPIIEIEDWDRRTGHAQAVAIESGFFQGAADPRGDGLALGW